MAMTFTATTAIRLNAVSMIKGYPATTVTFWAQRISDPGITDEMIFWCEGSLANTDRASVRIKQSDNFMYGRACAPDTDTQYQVATTGVISVDSTSEFPKNHYAFATDYSVQEQKIYVNGVLVATNAVALYLDTQAENANAGDDSGIGAKPTGNGTVFANPFSGRIADLRLYRCQLTADQIMTIYRCRGHDGILSQFASGEVPLGGRYTGTERTSTTVLTTSNIRDSSNAQNLGSPVSIRNSPTFTVDGLAYRRMVP